MRRFFIIMVSLLAMLTARISANAQEVTIDLLPGWNYISYPYPTTVELDTFFKTITPMNDDVIKSKWDSSRYLNGQWRGRVKRMNPGEGYHYFSNNPDVVTLVLDNPIVSEQTITVTTGGPTDITAESATIGGEVMLLTDTHVFMRGVCWGTTSNPDIDGSYFLDGAGTGSFTVTLDELTPNTTYYVRTYSVSDHGLVYGGEQSFTTAALPNYTVNVTANPVEGGAVSGAGNYEQGQSCTLTATANEGYTFANWTENDEVVSTEATYTFTVTGDRTLVANFTQNGGGNHAYVDLGLPSGLLWATCNVGAENPEDYGDYFAWGETQPKYTYNWSTYQYCNGSYNALTKYCSYSSYGYNGFTDNLTTLLPEDDAATANWGDGWRMPTIAEWEELINNTTVTWITQNGVNGRLFTASNGNSLFLPAAGCRSGSSLYDAGSYGHYWSSSLYTGRPYGACYFFFLSDGCNVDYFGRDSGQSVRPVRSGQN